MPKAIAVGLVLLEGFYFRTRKQEQEKQGKIGFPVAPVRRKMITLLTQRCGWGQCWGPYELSEMQCHPEHLCFVPPASVTVCSTIFVITCTYLGTKKACTGVSSVTVNRLLTMFYRVFVILCICRWLLVCQINAANTVFLGSCWIALVRKQNLYRVSWPLHNLLEYIFNSQDSNEL